MALDVTVLASPDLDRATLAALRQLWAAAFHDDFTDEDAEHAFGGVHVLIRGEHGLVSHASAVPRTILVGGTPFDAGYVEGVATLPTHQRQGLGRRAMDVLSQAIRDRFDLGVLSTGQSHFYESLGWEPWRGPSYVVRGGELVRTEDEDDGLMVLRFGRSTGVDLSSSIACFDRPGDAW